MDDQIWNIILCDDQPQSIAAMKEHLIEYLENNEIKYQILFFPAPAGVYEYMQSHIVHILFMDLEYGEKENDGILWTQRIRKEYPDVLVLILTAYEQRYKEGYKVRAFRFMTKPLIWQELVDNMNDCFREINDRKMIPLKHKTVLFSVPVRSILYLEAYAGESKVYTVDKVYYDQESLLQWEKKMPDFSFFRIHKKYLIHLYHVTEIVANKHEVILRGGIHLPVARRKWTEFLKKFMQYDISGSGHEI